MQVKALQMHALDNVAVCTADTSQGDVVTVIDPEKGTTEITSVSAIAFGNKIALQDIGVGDVITKYGEMIGRAISPIAKGELVNHLNIASQPRDYADEYLGGRGS